MRIYKERYTDKEGKRRKTTKWYIDFSDHRGKRHRLPDKLLKKLISIDLIDGHRAESGKLLMEHLDDYKDVLTAKGKSATHIRATISRIKAVSKDQGFEHIRDVRASDIVKYLGKLRQSDKTPTTRNHYLTAFKMFMNWLKDERGCKDEDKVFPNFNRHCRPSEWIKADLKAAGLPTKDYMGNKIDFHRGVFI